MKVTAHAIHRAITRCGESVHVLKEAEEARLLGEFVSYRENKNMVAYVYKDKKFVFNLKDGTLVTVINFSRKERRSKSKGKENDDYKWYRKKLKAKKIKMQEERSMESAMENEMGNEEDTLIIDAEEW